MGGMHAPPGRRLACDTLGGFTPLPVKGDNMPPRVGKRAPDFTLKDHEDREVRLSSFIGKNVVLAFFPLAWTPV
jgi:peroxiredoxin